MASSQGSLVAAMEVNIQEHYEVTNNSTFKENGDEAQILSKVKYPFFIDKNRSRAARKSARKHHDVDVIISDDGLQHYAMGRDIEIAVIDGVRRLGNGLAFPAGPLREPKSRLKRGRFYS